MNIKTKILMPPLFAVVMMLLLGAVSLIGMRSLQSALKSFAEENVQYVAAVNESRADLLQANIGAYRLFSLIANYDEARIKKETAAIMANADAAIHILKKLRERSDIIESEKKFLADLDEPLAKYRKNVAQAIDMAGADLATGTGMMQAADKRFIEIAGKLDTFADQQKKEAESTIAAAMTATNRAIAIDVGLFIVAVVAALAISLILAGKIVAPMTGAIRIAGSIASGNLANQVPAGSQDETGDLLRALGAMQDNLHQLIEQIGNNAQQTTTSCGSMSGALANINQAVANQNDATATVAAAVEEMSVSINSIHDSASHALAANQESSALAAQGVSVITSAFDEMTRISATVKDAAGVVGHVGQQSNEISSIVRVIREVADQTNLLALNAAIEAARAGEAGRGFAVVADEVRKLAEKTTGSAEEITRMIGAIQKSSNHAVSNIQQVVEQVGTTAAYADKAREAIERIRASAGQSENYSHEITAALGEQSQASNLIAQKVEGIARMSDENMQSVTHVGHSMSELEEQSRLLQSAVARFAV